MTELSALDVALQHINSKTISRIALRSQLEHAKRAHAAELKERDLRIVELELQATGVYSRRKLETERNDARKHLQEVREGLRATMDQVGMGSETYKILEEALKASLPEEESSRVESAVERCRHCGCAWVCPNCTEGRATPTSNSAFSYNPSEEEREAVEGTKGEN